MNRIYRQVDIALQRETEREGGEGERIYEIEWGERGETKSGKERE